MIDQALPRTLEPMLAEHFTDVERAVLPLLELPAFPAAPAPLAEEEESPLVVGPRGSRVLIPGRASQMFLYLEEAEGRDIELSTDEDPELTSTLRLEPDQSHARQIHVNAPIPRALLSDDVLLRGRTALLRCARSCKVIVEWI